MFVECSFTWKPLLYLSWSPRMHFHGNVFCTELFPRNGLHITLYWYQYWRKGSTSNASWDGALHVRISCSLISCYRDMFSYRRCESSTRLDGKVAIITGANCGIGKFTALDFVRRGEKLVVLEWLGVTFRIWEVARRPALFPKVFLVLLRRSRHILVLYLKICPNHFSPSSRFLTWDMRHSGVREGRSEV